MEAGVLEMIKGVSDRVLPGETDWCLRIHVIKKQKIEFRYLPSK